MKVTATVDRLRREGIAVLDFGAGEPDFATPAHIAAAAHAATAATLSAADEPRAAAPSWAARQVASAQLIPTPADRLRQQQLAEAGVSTQAAALWQLSQDDL